jgi:hypothetical protein
LNAQQEIYYSNPNNNYSYAPTVGALTDFTTSQGVTVGMASGTNTGWSATATHQALGTSTQFCAVYVGAATAISPAVTPGVVACTGE